MLAEADGVSRHEATVRAIHEPAQRHGRADKVKELSLQGRELYADLLDDALQLIADLQVGPIRDVGLLDAALHRPSVSVFGADAYPELGTKAAVLLESIVRNRPLVDGNKRLGWLSTVVFLSLNGKQLEAPDDDAYGLVVAVASGRIGYERSAETASTVAIVMNSRNSAGVARTPCSVVMRVTCSCTVCLVHADDAAEQRSSARDATSCTARSSNNTERCTVRR